MKYKISNKKPESFFIALQKRFGPAADWDKGICIAVGDTIYAKHEMSADFIEHEVTHLKQQKEIGLEKWWNLYLTDNDFLLKAELEAYRAQAGFIKKSGVSRQVYRKECSRLAKDLSGPIYGRVISYDDALAAIK